MKRNNINKMLSEAVTRLRARSIVATDLLPECGLLVGVERHDNELVETVRDLDQGGRIVQEMVLPQEKLKIAQVKQ